jgi:Protein of unknown function (DUF4127)
MTTPIRGSRGGPRASSHQDESNNIRQVAQNARPRRATPSTKARPATRGQQVSAAPARHERRAANAAPVPVRTASLSELYGSPAFKSVVNESKTAGLYRQPTPNNQDAQNNAVPKLGGKFMEAMPAFVFSPRRQSDQMVRQAHALLPSDIKRDVAFVSATRVAQDPEGAARQMIGKKEVVIVGSFKGVNTAVKDTAEFTNVHKQEMKALELSVKLANSMGVSVRDVVVGMGDSSPVKSNTGFVANSFASAKKAELETNMNAMLQDNGLKTPKSVSWGADELMVTAFAAQLPEMTLAADIQNPNAQSFYDASNTASTSVAQAAKKTGLKLVPSGQKADVNLKAFTLMDGANTARDQTYPNAKELNVQRTADQKFAQGIQSLDKGTLARTVVIDARLSNGAMDTKSLPPTTDVLGYSGWGTAGNNFGQGLAMAKIVAAAQDRAQRSNNPKEAQFVNAARRQLVVEAVAHDALFIGYANGASGAALPQPSNNALANWVRDNNLPKSPGDKLTETQLVGLHQTASRYATQVLKEKYPGLAGQVQFAPSPYNRRFESNTMYSKGVLPEAGSISLELANGHHEFKPSKTYEGWKPDPETGTQSVGSNGEFSENPTWKRQLLNKLGL